jgi:hypothetical protein
VTTLWACLIFAAGVALGRWHAARRLRPVIADHAAATARLRAKADELEASTRTMQRLNDETRARLATSADAAAAFRETARVAAMPLVVRPDWAGTLQ